MRKGKSLSLLAAAGLGAGLADGSLQCPFFEIRDPSQQRLSANFGKAIGTRKFKIPVPLIDLKSL
jgi:hypothetical protein